MSPVVERLWTELMSKLQLMTAAPTDLTTEDMMKAGTSQSTDTGDDRDQTAEGDAVLKMQ